MERRRVGKGSAGTAGQQGPKWIVALVVGAMYAVVAYFMHRTGYADAVRKATEPLEQSLAGLVLFALFLPTLFAAFCYIQRPYNSFENVPRAFRLAARVLDVLLRGLAFAGAWYLVFSLLPLVPFYAIFGYFVVSTIILVGLLIHRYIQEKAARKAVTALYEAIKNDDRAYLDSACEPEAVEELATLASLAGKLTWYSVMNIMYEEKHFTFMVQSIRDRMPKFEEVTIRPSGNRVVQVMAEGV
jgi:cation transport ATPase